MPPPRISGTLLRTVARAARTRAGALAIYTTLRKDLGFQELARLPESVRGNVPLHYRPRAGRPPRVAADAHLGLPPPPWSGTSASYAEAYARGRITPLEVIERCLRLAHELAARTPSVGPLVAFADALAREESGAATGRWATDRSRGPFDGVPYAVKEELSVRGLPRQSGTTFKDGAACAGDATVVARLREAGSVAIGTTSMTEYGMSPIGQNAMRALPKNPHAPGHVAGGSSTGSGVAVATGLVPFALGVDGGGSIRIPAALNGVFGIKPTWGRVSRAGDTSTGSLAHVGPLASSAADLARVLEVIAGADDEDAETAFGPAVARGSLLQALGRGVAGLRIGVVESEWAEASLSVQQAGREALRALAREGATLVDLKIPLARHAAQIGYMTIGMEARAALKSDWENHAEEMSPDLRITMAALGEARAAEYVDAQRLREGLRRDVAAAFQDVDLLAIPSTMATAAAASDDEMKSGFLDPRVLHSLCRFMFLGNLTGLPAATAPVGIDMDGLPMGFQLVGDAWDEATVLAAVAHLERIGVARVARPKVSVDPLEGAR